MEDTSQELLVRDEGFVRTLTINRPERANSLSRTIMARMAEAVTDADDDPNVRVIVLTGAGDRIFCGGADVKEIGAKDQAEERFRLPTHRPQRTLFEVVGDCNTPTIAAINGHAMGGGLELALACDLRVASEKAKLGMPEAKRGMGANFASVVLPRLIPTAIALEMLFTGEPITPTEAARWGLVNRVVPSDQVASVTATLAAQIAANAPLTVRYMKNLALRGASLPIQAATHLDFGPNPYLSEDRKEGIRAFNERRPPEWKGR